MKCAKEHMLLYAVTDRAWTGRQTLYQQVEAALKGGVTCVQLREKDMDKEAFLAEARDLRTLCRRYHVPFIVNDNVDIAIACGADGVHVGQSDMTAGQVRRRVGKDMILGVSVHTVEEARQAVQDGADYLGLGAVFPTSTKADADPMPHDTLRAICNAVPIPVVAIGGISQDNLLRLSGSGVDGVALVSAIFSAEDIEGTCRDLRALSEEMVRTVEMRSSTMKTALSIAGTDPSGGAGIQADLKTMTMNGVFAMNAITAVLAQNTTGVQNIVEMTPRSVAQQIDVVFEDIPPDAVKIGMVASRGLIETIAERLDHHHAKNIVVDPVMVSTSGHRLICEDAVDTLKTRLLPLAAVVTPNIPEAEILSGMKIHSKEDIEAAAEKIGDTYGCAVLLKGGHSINDANDFLYASGKGQWFFGTRINNPNTHGTGCTLSSAIAANLAKGFDLPTSIQRAKDYLSGALGAMLDLGKGRGPLRHDHNLTGRFAQEASPTLL